MNDYRLVTEEEYLEIRRLEDVERQKYLLSVAARTPIVEKKIVSRRCRNCTGIGHNSATCSTSSKVKPTNGIVRVRKANFRWPVDHEKLVLSSYIENSNPRFFNVDGQVMNAGNFSQFCAVSLFDKWDSDTQGACYRKNNTILETNYRLKEYKTRLSPRVLNEGAHYPRPDGTVTIV